MDKVHVDLDGVDVVCVDATDKHTDLLREVGKFMLFTKASGALVEDEPLKASVFDLLRDVSGYVKVDHTKYTMKDGTSFEEALEKSGGSFTALARDYMDDDPARRRLDLLACVEAGVIPFGDRLRTFLFMDLVFLQFKDCRVDKFKEWESFVARGTSLEMGELQSFFCDLCKDLHVQMVVQAFLVRFMFENASREDQQLMTSMFERKMYTLPFKHPLARKAVRMYLEESGVLPKTKRSTVLFATLRDIAENPTKLKEEWSKREFMDCATPDEAVELFQVFNAFINEVARHANGYPVAENHWCHASFYTDLFRDEFPELRGLSDGWYKKIEKLPAHVKKVYEKDKRPSQQFFVERGHMKARLYHAMHGKLTQECVASLRKDIVDTLTDDQYEWWRKVFQLKNDLNNRKLLKLTIQQAYLYLFCECFNDSTTTEMLKRATTVLQPLCKTDITTTSPCLFDVRFL